MFSALDFFAGSGLVGLGLAPEFETVWANDICPKKQSVYIANHDPSEFQLGGIEGVRGADLPRADVAWASFPCQDLSLAGNLSGMKSGTRSGLFWEWIRVLDELAAAGKRPPILVAENVPGFLAAHDGRYFADAFRALRGRGYRAGALAIDARMFVPQSRPRAFLVAVDECADIEHLRGPEAVKPFHSAAVVSAAQALNDPAWVWWPLPVPPPAAPLFSDLCDRAAPCNAGTDTRRLVSMLSAINRKKLDAAVRSRMFTAGTGYRRTRVNASGAKVQRLEVRFDGAAGCLRAPNGGSSRQIVILAERGRVRSRLMTVRECARLMGAPDSYLLPGTYNDGYRAMGDAVAVPVTRWLTQHLLAPLAHAARAPGRAGQYHEMADDGGGRSHAKATL